MFRWALDSIAQEQFDSLPERARRALTEILDAAVLVDPLAYQPGSGTAEPLRPLRTLHFGTSSNGLVTFLVYEPDNLVLVVRIQWLDA